MVVRDLINVSFRQQACTNIKLFCWQTYLMTKGSQLSEAGSLIKLSRSLTRVCVSRSFLPSFSRLPCLASITGAWRALLVPAIELIIFRQQATTCPRHYFLQYHVKRRLTLTTCVSSAVDRQLISISTMISTTENAVSHDRCFA